MELETLNETLEGIDSSFKEFKQSNDEQYQDLKERLEKAEIKLDTPEFTTGDASPEIKGLNAFLRSGNAEHIEKAMSIGTDSSGGYTHVPELGKQIIEAVGEINPLMREVDKKVIDANVYDQIFTTTRSASARSAESGARSETATATFEKVTVTLYDLYCYPKITNELRYSTQFDLDAWIRTEIAEAQSEALGTEFVTGDGSSKSVGLLNSMSAAVLGASPDLPWGSIHYRSNGSPSTVSYAALLDVISALPVRYKAAGNAKWYMSTAQIEAVRGLLDANNLPIWRQDFGVAGAPMVLLGYPVVEVPQLGSQGWEILLGDMRKAYTFVSNDRGIGLLIDQITDPGFTKFYASLQCAGGVMDSRALVALAS